MPHAEDKRNLLMTEFMSLKCSANAGGIRQAILEIERITDSWGRVAGRPFDEESKVGKLRELVPSGIWDFIAQRARQAKTFSWILLLNKIRESLQMRN